MSKLKSPCCHCGQGIPPELLEQKRLQRLARLKATHERMKAKGVPIGRAPSVSTPLVLELVGRGFSQAGIARALGVPYSTIQGVVRRHGNKKAPSMAPVERPSMELDFEILPGNNRAEGFVFDNRQK